MSATPSSCGKPAERDGLCAWHDPAIVRRVLEARGLSQDAFAGLCCVSRLTVRRWTEGTHGPPGPVRVLCEILLGGDVEQLVDLARAEAAPRRPRGRPRKVVPTGG